MDTKRSYICEECGAVYHDYAEYCNICGSTRFKSNSLAPLSSPSLSDKTTHSAALLQGSIWLIGLLLFVSNRRYYSIYALGMGWLTVFGLSLLASIITRHFRMGALFAIIGALFFILAVLVRGLS